MFSMSDYRNIKADPAGPEGASSRFHVVPTPAPTDGVGEALRNAFACGAQNSVEDFDAMLREIDIAMDRAAEHH